MLAAPLETHDGPGRRGKHPAPARRVHRICRDDLVGIERQDNARRRDERARVAKQEELPVPLAVLISRIVDDDGLGVATADGATVVRGALVGDDDLVGKSARDGQEPVENPRLVADRRDHTTRTGSGGDTVLRYDGPRGTE